MSTKAMKYQISYTLNSPNAFGYHRKYFPTKAAANKWFKEHKSGIYWHQLTETNPKSKLPKPIIAFDPPFPGYVKKQGTLQRHYETGMECLGLVFYEDGIHSGPNPDFDPSKPEGPRNFQYFSSYDGQTYIETGHIIQFPNGERVGMAKDREFAKRDGYRLSFYPQGFSRSDWLDLFKTDRLPVTIWIPEDKHAKDLKKFIRGPF